MRASAHRTPGRIWWTATCTTPHWGLGPVDRGTEHFAAALLRVGAPERRWSITRLATHNAATVAVLYGVAVGPWPVAAAGAAAVVGVVVWHATVLAGMLKRALPGPFGHVIGWYLAAAGALTVGGALGGLSAVGRRFGLFTVTAFLPVQLVTGVAMAAHKGVTWASLAQPGYGRILAAKPLLFCAVMLTAGLHGWASGTGRPAAARALATAALVGTPPAGTARPAPSPRRCRWWPARSARTPAPTTTSTRS
ncbi:hypothetical protein ABZ860_34575 [Microbispora sp. NPDC046973]|uniref:hypothetical protein n=1 Tax=Microbispora sp. NPDC046973 TaxID=3155022 RepID=UPI0033D73402